MAEEKKENKKDSAGESVKPQPVVAEGGEKKANAKGAAARAGQTGNTGPQANAPGQRSESAAAPAKAPPAAGKGPAKPAETKPQPPKTGLTDEVKDRIRREIAAEKIIRSSTS